ncbi:MAG TPA: CrcB family protein [Thermoplasmata archaeon]|nr:CrcB family protein [Thermoplasmata archaeon]
MDANGLRLVALVAAGGALGSVARYGVSGLLTKGAFPWGTFAVNLTGTFLLAAIFFLALGRGYLSAEWRTFLFIGAFGGYTTFSTFGLETVVLLREGQGLLAAINVGLNGGVCLGGAVAGALLGVFLGGG